jgi:transposase
MDTEQAASPSLPDDIEALRAMVMALMTERDTVTSQLDAVTAERDTLLERNERLHHLLLKLKRMQFGTKSERLPEEQLQLGLEAIAKNEAEAEKRDPELRKDRVAKRRSRNAALPADLPRIEVTLEPDDKASLLPGDDDRDRRGQLRAAG